MRPSFVTSPSGNTNTLYPRSTDSPANPKLSRQPACCFAVRPARINGVGSPWPAFGGARYRTGKQTLDIRDAVCLRKRCLVQFNLIALLKCAHQFHPVQRAEIQSTLERNRTLRG